MPVGTRRVGLHRMATLSLIPTLVATMLIALTPNAGEAQEPDQVQDVTVTQREGFATVAWTLVPGAAQYQIYRTPVDADDEPTGDPVLVGVWRPNRQINQESPTFADAGFNPGGRFGWQVRAQLGSGLPNEVTVDAPSSAAGTYGASQATYGPVLDATGLSGSIVLVDDGSDAPTEGCDALIDFPAGSIALMDRGSCNFTVKTANAQEAGATAVILANNTGGTPTNPTGSDPSITIPTVMVSQDDGATLKAGLPATGKVAAAPMAPLSDPAYGTTTPAPGPEEFRTQFELTQGAQFTSYESEIAWTEQIAAASDRVRVVTIGHTVLGREINLFIIGLPAPLGTAEEISDSPTVGANCNVHGNEPSGREGCLMMIRELAFSNDPEIIDVLTNATVLVVPAINGDGRAANTRGNSTGQDLNRDHGRLTQPETQAFAAFLRDYTPEVMVDGHEFGNTGTCDLPLLWPRHSNTAPTVHNEAKEGLVEDWFYTEGAADGWWGCPYPVLGIAGAQTFTRVTGLKNMIVTLVEARSSGGPTRPDEGNTQNNRRRKAYSQVWAIRQALEYHRANQTEVGQAIADGIAFQSSNTGPVVFHGDWDVEPFPPPHPGDTPPANNPPGPEDMLDPPPCGYFLTEEQYTTPLDDSGSLPAELRTSPEQRLAAHGIAVEERPDGYLVRMTQPLRGLINIVLDPEQPPAPIIGVERVYECPEAAADPAELAAAAVEETQVSLPLSIANVAPQPNADLTWSITEAESSCDDPSDLGWVSAAPSDGATPAGSSTEIEVTFDATELTAPDVHAGMLCIATNDIGDAVVEIPLEFQVQYPLTWLSPAAAPPALAPVSARQMVPVRFSLAGDRGLSFVAAGSPVSQQVDCVTLEPVGSVEAAVAAGPLVYDASGDRYRYAWGPSAQWAGSCRVFVMALDDASEHATYFRFRR